MKFNWKANWEILLVLAIIVVGIVITTIAAIRNKDKHILAPDEAADFGQLLTPAGQQESLANHVSGDQRQHSLSSAPGSAQDEGGGLAVDRSQHQQTAPLTAIKTNRHPQLGSMGAVARQPARLPQTQPDGRQSKFDDNPSELARLSGPAHTAPVPLTRDHYEALSTEPTPSSILSGSAGTLSLGPLHLQQQQQQQFLNHNRRQVNRSAITLVGDESTADGEPVELIDDIHTTRSSLANAQLAVNQHNALEHLQGLPSPSLAMHGPYGSPTAGSTPLIRHHQTGPMLDMDELLSTYSRSPSNLTEGMVNDYSLAAALNSSSHHHLLANILAAHQHQQQQANAGEEGTFAQQQAQPTSAYHRAYTSGTAHLTTLLNDLLKMARPQLPADGSTTPKPQAGILQQLRSLPSPLQSLLQALAPAAQAANLEQTNFPNHETSESSQHYQRVLMSPTDMHSVITRSLRGSSILPAFPAPKGTPQTWIPPTSGGDPSFHAAHNSQADFIASNSAGFIRQAAPTGAYQPGASSADQQYHALDQHQHQHQHQHQNQHQHPHQQQSQSVLSSSGSGLYQQQEQQQQQSQQQQQQHSQQHAPNGQHEGPLNQQQPNERYDQPGQIYVLPASEQAPHRARPNSDASSGYRQQNHQLSGDPNYQASSSQIVYSKQHQGRVQVQPGNHANHAPAQALGYNPQMQTNQLSYNQGQSQVQQQQQQQRFDMANSPGESKPQAIIVSGPSKPALRVPVAGAPKSRRKRSLVRAARYQLGEEEDEEDSSPLSVVSPDGQPMSGGRLRELGTSHALEPQLVSQSKRSSNHLDLDDQREAYVPPLRTQLAKSSKGTNKAKIDANTRKGANIAAAGSDLMTRLLTGMSSNLDELDDSELNDDDEDSARERRKEALDDAEFGMSKADRRRKKSRKDKQVSAKTKKKANSIGADARLGSGSSDSQSYASRRQQQRSDIEFYGHPGEETRQLKYGILGSGNYEVVNGGIYPEADESTAAVNSVANYVRKPGTSGLLAALPKLLGDAASGAAGSPGTQAAFLPGARLSGGFMRGSSDNTEGFVGLLPGAGETLVGADKDLAARPLLEFIDAHGGAGQLFDANLLAQLGSSGSSTKTIHADADADANSDQDKSDSEQPARSANKLARAKGDKVARDEYDKAGATQEAREPEEGRLQRQSSSISSSRSRGLNQFNSYQISPSKKVTIFSDQDLDSAPSDLNSHLWQLLAIEAIGSSSKQQVARQ